MTIKIAFAMALVALALLAAKPAHAKIAITSCTPTFVAKTPGATYDIAANLTASGNCINVTAPGVTISLGGFSMTGNGTGSGIYIAPGKTGVQVIGPGYISGFNIGVVDLGNSALIQSATIFSNAAGGIFLSAVDGSVAADNYVVKNGVFGILLQNTTNSVAQYNTASTNGTFGIWVQNNSTTATLSSHNDIVGNEANQNVLGIWVGYNGTPACPAVPPSTFNILVNNNPVDSNTQIGIGLQCNTAQNTTVLNNVASLGEPLGGYDGTAGCGTNFWNVDTFIAVNQPCVK